MDRRDFLKTTGAAAVAAGSTAAATRAESTAARAQQAPAVQSGAHDLILASSWLPDLPGFGVERLAQRLQTATAGRCRIAINAGAADADLTFGLAHRHHERHPALAYFGGLPASQGLDAPALQTWLAAGGGQMLWDDLAGEFGFKPLLAGHTGPSAGLWSMRRLETAADMAGARLHTDGLAADLVQSLGATAVALTPQDLQQALASGRIDGAEWAGPALAAAPDLQPLAERLYQPGFNRHGLVLSLGVRRDLWDRMSASDQAIFEACAAEEYHLSLAESRAHDLIGAQLAAPAKRPLRLAFSPDLAGAVERAAERIVAGLAATDHRARRIDDSYRAFRTMLGEPRTV